MKNKNLESEYISVAVTSCSGKWFDRKNASLSLWFWCDVSLALTPSWTLWELLGIERLIGVFELGDLIECSCHNISNTVLSPIMTQLGHNGHITKKRRGREKGKKEKEHFLCCEVARIIIFFFTTEPPLATATLITGNYFFLLPVVSAQAPLVAFGIPPQHPVSVGLH